MSISYAKGLRTRYRNLLEKEMAKVEPLLNQEVTDEDLTKAVHKVGTLLTKLKDFSSKYDESTEKYLGLLDETDSKTELKAFHVEEDEVTTFIGNIMETISELSVFEIELKERKNYFENKKSSSTNLSAQFEKLLEIQTNTQMQTRELIQAQQIQAQQLQQIQNSSTHFPPTDTSIRLPQIEIPKFNGDIMLWDSFWDSFDATVNKNNRLSPVEKLTYLCGKLTHNALDTISGLSISNDNYDVALKLLHERYGDKQAIINSHYTSLIDLPTCQNNISSLRSLYDKIERHLRCLEAQDQDINQDIFVTMLISKLHKDILVQLEIQKPVTTRWNVPLLRQQLKTYLMAREQAERHSITSKPKDNEIPKSQELRVRTFQNHYPKFNSKWQPRSSSETLVANNKGPPKTLCRYCDRNHWSDECDKFPNLQTRKERIKASCYNCLKKNHMIKNCSVDKPCFHCNRRRNHHRSLCPKQFSANEYSHLNEEIPEKDFVDQALIASIETVLMQTAKTEICSPDNNKTVTVRILMDSGSHRTYITEKLASNLNLKLSKTKEEISLMTFGSSKPQVIKTPTAQVKLKLRDGTYMSIKVNVVPTITGSIQRVPLKTEFCQNWNYLWKDINLADTFPKESETSTIDILIGNDYYLDIILPQKMNVSKGLYLLGSKLGWILTGRTTNDDKDELGQLGMLTLTQGPFIGSSTFPTLSSDPSLPIKPDLEQFWKLENIGITDCPYEIDDDIALEAFNQTVKYQDNRYLVSWPWKNSNIDLPTNYHLAKGRFKSLMLKLCKSEELFHQYNSIICDQLNKGIVEKVTNDSLIGTRQHYIPHHPVINTQRTSTKVRIVYDASAKVVKSQPSLNECLYRGPVMLHHLCGLLLRFRTQKVSLTADIEKAFLQVGLQPMERDVTRFLWLKDDTNLNVNNNIQVYRFTRVPFGIVSSPFLLAATIAYHLGKIRSSTAIKIKENIYVDNVITGCDTVTQALSFYNESKAVFESASMNLREWSSNSFEVMKQIPEIDKTKGDEIKVLGLKWKPKVDQLTIEVSYKPTNNNDSTKREVLSVISSVFDPLGLFHPVTLKSKLFIQLLWKDKLEWDESLGEKQNQWNILRSDFKQISTLPIPRYLHTQNMDSGTENELCCFCDASAHAYAAVIYLRVSNGPQINLLISKTRIAPIKKVTIPRLELLAVLIGVRLIKFVLKEIGIKITTCSLWSDSQCVLSWIRTSKPLPCFVENRIKEIRSHENITFKYICSEQNPADIATRGCTFEDLKNSETWWHGPNWLSLPVDLRPHYTFDEIDSTIQTNTEPIVLYETKLLSQETKLYEDSPFFVNDVTFSSISRLHRVTAWCLRFVNKLRKRSIPSGPLTSEEIENAKLLWEKQVQGKHYHETLKAIEAKKPNNLQQQLGLIIDKDGILRCLGRMQNSELSISARLPKLLPTKDPYTKLVIESFHKKCFHFGVSQTLATIRQEYWIPRGRATVKNVIHNCRICRRWEGGPYRTPPMPPFPAERVSRSTPFTFTGVDYLGPLLIRDNSNILKIWICLFTCLATRAVHLELVTDMTANCFLLCLRRFISRCGKPQHMISDNAPHFKVAKIITEKTWNGIIRQEDVHNYCSNEGIHWHFIIQLAPWMGGFYERLVGLVKRSLRKSIGKLCLTYEQLDTLLTEIEVVINNRPLLYVDDDINSTMLTPADLLGGSKFPFEPIPMDALTEYFPRSSTHESLVKSWKLCQNHLHAFWVSWRNDYLQNLRERKQMFLKGSHNQSPLTPNVGDIVILKDKLPRGLWRLGKIKELIISRDQQIRAAKVILPSKKVFTRSLKLLYPIECPLNEDTSVCEPIKVSSVKPQRKAAILSRKLFSQQI